MKAKKRRVKKLELNEDEEPEKEKKTIPSSSNCLLILHSDHVHILKRSWLHLSKWECARESVRVRVCVSEREREREREMDDGSYKVQAESNIWKLEDHKI